MPRYPACRRQDAHPRGGLGLGSRSGFGDPHNGDAEQWLDVGVADISRSRTITAEPQAIWDVLADFGALSSWADGVDHSCVLNHGPDGGPLGTTRRVQVGRNALVERITEFDPPATLAYDIEGLPEPVAQSRQSLDAAADGPKATPPW